MMAPMEVIHREIEILIAGIVQTYNRGRVCLKIKTLQGERIKTNIIAWDYNNK